MNYDTDYATHRAAESAWHQLTTSIERGGPARAVEALTTSEFGVWNTYGGSSYISDMDMVCDPNGKAVTVTATACNGNEYKKTIKMNIPTSIWMR